MISQEHGSMAYEFDFQFTDVPGFWVRADVTVQEAFEVLKTGLLRNRSVAKIKMFAITEDKTSVSFVYDVTKSKTGEFPWSLTQSS